MALNFKDKFVNALFGAPVQVEQPESAIQYKYPTQRQTDYMRGLLNNKDLLGKIQASPYNQGYTDEEIINRVAQGQNFGLPELANEQKQWGIKLPRANNSLDEEALRGNYLNVYEPLLQTGTATSPSRQGGFFNDLVSGYQENATQGFNINNLAPVQGKGLATRLGEGLGTLARFYDKPIGRMAVATGLSMLTDEANPLGEGVKAYVGRQNNMTQDRVYRNQLKQLGMTDDELNSIPGNVTKDVFEGVTSGMRLGNQRMTYGQLAMLDDDIADEVRKNPALANMFVPINIARDIYGLKRETAQGKMAEIAAKTKKTEAETKQVGKPKVTINRREGGTTSTVNIVHSGGSGKGSGTSNRSTQNNYVKMQAPNGKIYNVPRSRMREYINAGGKVVD